MKPIRSGYEQTKVVDEPKVSELNSTTELLSFEGVEESGIFKLTGKRYSKMYLVSDSNFEGKTSDEKKKMIMEYEKVLKTIPCRFQITIANEYVDEAVFTKSLRYESNDKGKEALVDSLNDVISEKVISAKQGLVQRIYLTLTITANDMEDAISQFLSMEGAIKAAFIGMGESGEKGVVISPVSANKRLQLLFNFTHFDSNFSYKLDYKKELSGLKSIEDVIAPSSLVFHNEYFEMGEMIGKVFYIESFPNLLESDIVSCLTKLNVTSYLSINNELLDLSDFKMEVSKKYMSLGMKIEGEKKRNRNNNDFLADASYKLLNEKEKMDKFMKEIDSEDEHYFNTTVVVLVLCKSLDELKEVEEKLNNQATLKSIELKSAFSRQKEGINSVLPLGVQEFKKVTNLSSSCLAMLMPFKTEELNDKNGLYYGINQISQNVVRADKKRLKNHNGLILGQSGSGKSAFAKLEMISAHVTSDIDQIMVVDPMGEYKDIAKALDGEVISFDTGKDVYLNPMDVDYSNANLSDLRDIISDKADFILTLLSICIKRELTTLEQGIIDSVVERVYSANYSLRMRLNGQVEEKSSFEIPEYLKSKNENFVIDTNLSNEEQIKAYSPTLQDIYQGLMDEDSKEAIHLATSMEIFVNGSLNLFNHRTNVDLDNRYIVFDLSSLKENLRISSMLIMMETLKDRIKRNASSNVWTHLYIDEFHELLGVEQVANFVLKLWKEIRKLQGILVGITQNMTDLLNNDTSNKLSAILSNTEFFALLSQSSLDKDKLIQFLPNISTAMFNYVDNAESGCGLLRFGTVTVPIDIRMSKDSYIYSIINTDGKDNEV